MELRIPTLEQLRTVYDRDLRTAFPAAELKPLKNMEEMWAEGRYRPWCLFDGDDIAGEAFLWLGHPGWALLDYLCVAADRRNGGLGSVILEKLREAERGNVIFGESEIPCYAPDPAMAERRLGFYARNGAGAAGMTRRCSAYLQDPVLGGGESGRVRPDGGAPLCLCQYLCAG